mmetsp:Transcript_6841/g.12636  ORF Transcript_6841/g.12636 Transcript_6841/m.12636 type:complete len:224 (-) Transcript_6841:263-934(-)
MDDSHGQSHPGQSESNPHRALASHTVKKHYYPTRPLPILLATPGQFVHCSSSSSFALSSCPVLRVVGLCFLEGCNTNTLARAEEMKRLIANTPHKPPSGVGPPTIFSRKPLHAKLSNPVRCWRSAPSRPHMRIAVHPFGLLKIGAPVRGSLQPARGGRGGLGRAPHFTRFDTVYPGCLAEEESELVGAAGGEDARGLLVAAREKRPEEGCSQGCPGGGEGACG